MPELAEVEFIRKQWDPGIRRRVTRVAVHSKTRVFRGEKSTRLVRALTGAKLIGSEARAKQMLFRFATAKGSGKHAWLGIHLGMTGKLRVEDGEFEPARHDHLVLWQAKHALVFTDPRQFGRVRFHFGDDPPEWWTQLPPAVTSDEFTLEL